MQAKYLNGVNLHSVQFVVASSYICICFLVSAKVNTCGSGNRTRVSFYNICERGKRTGDIFDIRRPPAVKVTINLKKEIRKTIVRRGSYIVLRLTAFTVLVVIYRRKIFNANVFCHPLLKRFSPNGKGSEKSCRSCVSDGGLYFDGLRRWRRRAISATCFVF